MDTSLHGSQKSSIQFFEKGDLSRLYEKEYNEHYFSDIFGAFLPTEKEQWVEQMFNTQSTVQTRVTMLNKSDIHETAARLMFGIIKGHKLVDGNKRSSILCMIGFYFINKYTTNFNPENLYNKTKDIAKLDSQTIDDEKEIRDLAGFLEDNTTLNIHLLVLNIFKPI